MNGRKLLEKQHSEVNGLFRKLERAKPSEKGRLFDELAAKLVSHDAIEREIFYPAFQKKLGKTDELGEALVEHGVVEFCLHKADAARGTDDFDACLTVLKEVLNHHIDEEEEEFFPKAARAFGKEMLEDLGEQMKERFEEKLAEPWRAPLLNNLRQVLHGTIKPKPKKPKKKAA